MRYRRAPRRGAGSYLIHNGPECFTEPVLANRSVCFRDGPFLEGFGPFVAFFPKKPAKSSWLKRYTLNDVPDDQSLVLLERAAFPVERRKPDVRGRWLGR